MRVRLAIGAVVVAAVVPAAAARTAEAPTATPPPVSATGCEEHQAWVDGDAKVVAARLPDRYTAVMDGGSPLLFVRAQHCDALEGAPVTIASWGIVVETPDGGGCASGVPGAGPAKGDVPPACNWYTLALLTDDQRVVDWLRQGTPSIPARRVEGLAFRRGAPDATGRSPFHFAGDAFTIDDVSSLRPGEIALRGGYWFETPQGTVRMGISTDDLSGGHADSVVHAARGSELATLMGATSRTSVEPYSDFGVIRAKHGVLRKQLVGPALPGEQLDSFAGACSLQGDVTFTPPATNDQAPTFYTYDAAGTCSGTLDGRRLQDAPVKLIQSGHADASCLHAQTFPPSTGRLVFDGGTELSYTLDFTSKATENDGTAYGSRSGSAPMHSTFLTQRSSPQVVTDCGGSGAAKAPMDLSLRTSTPLVSGRPGPAESRRLAVSPRPRRAHAGRRTTFLFHVTTSGGQPAPGALVRFAGRRARTAARGDARIVAAVRRRGHRAVSVSLPGFPAARATVTVVR
jgi:hypothetical protein